MRRSLPPPQNKVARKRRMAQCRCPEKMTPNIAARRCIAAKAEMTPCTGPCLAALPRRPTLLPHRRLTAGEKQWKRMPRSTPAENTIHTHTDDARITLKIH